jgi:glycosyltransferase involved in cell wall biosynthesis
MKVAIYETVHLDWIIPYAELLSEEDISVSFITSASFKDDLQVILAEKNPGYTWYFIDSGGGYMAFFKKIYSVLNSVDYDVVILNSVDSRLLILFMILVLSRPQRILVNLHDINNFFKIKPSRKIRTNVRSIGKKLLMLLADGYIVNAATMREYILKNQFTKKPVYWLPPVHYKPSSNDKKTTFVNTIVIPGTIDQRRRDYDLVLEVIQELLKYKVTVKWILAGKPMEDYGVNIIEKAKKLNNLGADISFYNEIIPENQFQQIIAASSLILSPLISTTTIHDGIVEVYGESKGSGNVYDAIRHAKPLIIPSTVTVPEEIISSCIKYNSKDNLVEQLLELLNNYSTFSSYTQNAARNSQKFRKEKIKNKFKEAIVKEDS